LRDELSGKVDNLKAEMTTRFDSVDRRLDDLATKQGKTDKTLDNHEKRIKRLETN
jgi:hypothetical protein